MKIGLRDGEQILLNRGLAARKRTAGTETLDPSHPIMVATASLASLRGKESSQTGSLFNLRDIISEILKYLIDSSSLNSLVGASLLSAVHSSHIKKYHRVTPKGSYNLFGEFRCRLVGYLFSLEGSQKCQ